MVKPRRTEILVRPNMRKKPRDRSAKAALSAELADSTTWRRYIEIRHAVVPKGIFWVTGSSTDPPFATPSGDQRLASRTRTATFRSPQCRSVGSPLAAVPASLVVVLAESYGSIRRDAIPSFRTRCIDSCRLALDIRPKRDPIRSALRRHEMEQTLLLPGEVGIHSTFLVPIGLLHEALEASRRRRRCPRASTPTGRS
jgi:hypothetical protein